MKRTYKSYDEIRAAIYRGIPVYWSNKGYQVMLEEIHSETQRDMPGVKHETMIVARFLSNWFGGHLAPSEISACFSEIES